jgi:hypothetical protein
MGEGGMDWIDFRIGTGQYGNEHSGSIKCEKYLD